MTTIPPPPNYPPTAGQKPPVYTPVPIPGSGPAVGVPSMEEAAAKFWAPAGKLLSDWWLRSGPEHISVIASQVGQQVTTLLTETEAQRAAREQVQHETLIASQRAMRDAQFAALGETPPQRAERHRLEKVLTAGRAPHRDDLIGLVDMLGDRITETPQERAARKEFERELDKKRRRAEEDLARAAAGETPEQRSKRHREQQLADKREAKTRARRDRRRSARVQGPSDRVRRFRRWCLLTAASASCGYSLIEIIAPGGPYVGLLLAAGGWVLDMWMRDKGRQHVSEVRGFVPVCLLIAVRIPVAAGLTVALQIDGMLAALPL